MQDITKGIFVIYENKAQFKHVEAMEVFSNYAFVTSFISQKK